MGGLFSDFPDHIKNVTDLIFCKLKKAQKTWIRSHFLCGQENLTKAPLQKISLSPEIVHESGLG